MATTALVAYERAAASGQKTYSRTKVSSDCEQRVHSLCSGAYHALVSYTVPTRYRCPCKCHAPGATCRRCGMGGLAWAEVYVRRTTAWRLYQPLERVVNATYRLEHTCGVDHNVAQRAEGMTQDVVKAERDWVRAERFEAREAEDDRRSAALTAYSPMIHDLARPGSLTFAEIVGDELPNDEDIRARARALFDAGKGA